MHHIHDPNEFVFPKTTVAALLVLAVTFLKQLGFSPPTAAEVIKRLDVSRSRAYALKDRLVSLLDDLVGPTGRPPKAPGAPAPQDLATQVLAYLYEHPGAVSGSDKRHRYDREFRLFIIELAQAHPEVDRAHVAWTLSLPLATLEDWLRDDSDVLPRDEGVRPPERTPPETLKSTHIASVIHHDRTSI